MQYAIINFTKQTTQFFACFNTASAAIADYNVAAEDVVYIVDLESNAIERL